VIVEVDGRRVDTGLGWWWMLCSKWLAGRALHPQWYVETEMRAALAKEKWRRMVAERETSLGGGHRGVSGCQMLASIANSEWGTSDRECGEPPAWRHGETYCCQGCWQAMKKEDEDLIRGWEPVPSVEGSERESRDSGVAQSVER